MSHTLHTGNSAVLLQQYPDNHFDSIITDPPYGIEFLGKAWDSNTGAIEIWSECFRVLKPGGHLLAFSAARTYHHLATNIEGVGFEIRDQLMWIYSSGFPKAQDMGKMADSRILKGNAGTRAQRQMALGDDYTQVGHYTIHSGDQASELAAASQHNDKGTNWQPRTEVGRKWAGWKTALKPGHEPIVMARKPFKGSTIDNIQQHGVGALNIDATRIMYEDERDLSTYINNIAGPLERSTATAGSSVGMHEGKTGFKVQKGRVKRPQAGRRTASFSFGHKDTVSGGDGSPEFEANPQGRFPSNVLGDIPDYQKYFYCPKVSRRERHCGYDKDSLGANINANTHGKTPYCDDCHKTFNGSNDHADCDPSLKTFKEHRDQNKPLGNHHPTVKPVALMKYLIRLVTPANSTVLDPFMGSGTTGMASRELGHTFVGCELDPAYVTIADRRIEGWLRTEGNPANPTHIPAPFGSVKGCYQNGERFAVAHQKRQQDTTFNTLFEEGTE